jgi:hypothetical protein
VPSATRPAASEPLVSLTSAAARVAVTARP